MDAEIIDDGEYVARVVACYRNSDGLVLTRFAIVDPENDAAVLTEIIVSFDPKSPMKFLRFLRSIGYPTPDNQFFVNLSDLRDRLCLVDVETWQRLNKTTGLKGPQNFISRFLPRGDSDA